MRYSYDPEFIDDMEFVFHNSTDELWDLSSDFDRAINKGFFSNKKSTQIGCALLSAHHLGKIPEAIEKMRKHYDKNFGPNTREIFVNEDEVRRFAMILIQPKRIDVDVISS